MKAILVGVALVLVLGLAGFFLMAQMSQSGVAPGLIDGRLSPCPESPNCVSSEPGASAEQMLDPLPGEVWARLPAAVLELGGKVISSEPTYLAAEFSSATFGFVDDVEFRLSGDVVQVRSASRVGYSDGGVNHARVAALRAQLGL